MNTTTFLGKNMFRPSSTNLKHILHVPIYSGTATRDRGTAETRARRNRRKIGAGICGCANKVARRRRTAAQTSAGRSAGEIRRRADGILRSKWSSRRTVYSTRAGDCGRQNYRIFEYKRLRATSRKLPRAPGTTRAVGTVRYGQEVGDTEKILFRSFVFFGSFLLSSYSFCPINIRVMMLSPASTTIGTRNFFVF